NPQSPSTYKHDSIFLAEYGPTHQPIEQLASLRAIPHLQVWRPGDPLEVAAAWAAALQRKEGPTALVLTRQKLPPLSRAAAGDVQKTLRGAYTLVEAKGDPGLVIVATGPER